MSASPPPLAPLVEHRVEVGRLFLAAVGRPGSDLLARFAAVALALKQPSLVVRRGERDGVQVGLRFVLILDVPANRLETLVPGIDLGWFDRLRTDGADDGRACKVVDGDATLLGLLP